MDLPDEKPVAPRGPGGCAVFAVGGALLVLVALTFGLARLFRPEVQAEELVAEVFGAAGLPEDYRLEKAQALPEGGALLRLVRSAEADHSERPKTSRLG